MEVIKFVAKMKTISSFIDRVNKVFKAEKPIMDYDEMIDQEKMSLFESRINIIFS